MGNICSTANGATAQKSRKRTRRSETSSRVPSGTSIPADLLPTEEVIVLRTTNINIVGHDSNTNGSTKRSASMAGVPGSVPTTTTTTTTRSARILSSGSSTTRSKPSNPLIASDSNEGEGFQEFSDFLIPVADDGSDRRVSEGIRQKSSDGLTEASRVSRSSNSTSISSQYSTATNEYVPGAEPKRLPDELLQSPTETCSTYSYSYSLAEQSPNRCASPDSGTLTPPFRQHSAATSVKSSSSDQIAANQS